MKEVYLFRITESMTEGSFGLLQFPEDPVPILTLIEPPWQNNQRDISCIPGEIDYIFFHRISARRGFVFEARNVAMRGNIQFHIGNIWHPDLEKTDTRGCICPGLRFGKVKIPEKGIDQFGVLDSRKAFTIMKNRLFNEEYWKLKVRKLVRL